MRNILKNELNSTDTAHNFWNSEWSQNTKQTEWKIPDYEVIKIAKKLKKKLKILDLGSGIGRHSLLLAEMGHQVFATDASKNGITILKNNASSNGLKIDVKQSKMTSLAYEDNKFDHILSWNVIYHGNEEIILKTIREIKRVLKINGTFHFTMLPKERLMLNPYKRNGKEISKNTWISEVEQEDKTHPHYFCDYNDLIELFKGFEFFFLNKLKYEKPNSIYWHLFARLIKK